MATPVADSYSGTVSLNCGRYVSGLIALTGDVVVAGDYLTDTQYNSGGYRMGFPLTLFPPRIVFNAGWQAQTIYDLANRFQAIIDAFPNINTWVIRIGTNGPGATTYQDQFSRLFTMLSASGKKGVFHAIPPKTLGTTGVNSVFVAQNAWLKSTCDASPSSFAFIQDSQDLGDANYNAIASYYTASEAASPIHMNGKGVYAQAKRMAPFYSTIFSPVEARLLDATDKYPSNATSNQYCQNPHMAGTGGSVGSGVTGVAPNNWSLGGYGGGTGGVASIVAADAGDAVQVQWMRVSNIVSGGNTHALNFDTVLQHPAIAADGTIKRFDITAEIRLNGLDPTVLSGLSLFPNVGGTAAGIGSQINLAGISGLITERMVFRTSLPRTQQGSSGNSAVLVAYSANTLKLNISLSFSAAQASIAGSIDIRCVSVRGSTT